MKTVRQYVGGGVFFFGVLVFVLGVISPTVARAVAEKITSVVVANDAGSPIPVAVVNTPAPNQFVTLTRLSASSAGYRQQFANGDSENVDYSVPAGSVLVVTDIEVVFRRGPGAAGQTAFYFLTNGAIRTRLHAALDLDGNGGASRHLQTGIVIDNQFPFLDNLPVSSFDAVILRGYLASEN